MNNHWNQLLQALDAACGSPDLSTSRLKTLKQSFDNQRQEHQVQLLYAYRRGGEVPSVKREYRKKMEGNVRKSEASSKRKGAPDEYSLLKVLNDSAAARTDDSPTE